MPVLEGAVLGAYELLQRIASDGMAEVYCARQLSAFGREVALKVILPRHTHDQALRTRFLREAYTISRLAHPNILPLIEFGDEHGTCYLVTPLLREGTLYDLLQQHGARPTEQALSLFLQLCDAVQYAHTRGIIHGDIKPRHIFLQGGRHVLLDWSSALTLLDAQTTIPDPGSGRNDQRAPEQTPEQADAHSDLYRLGVILQHLLTGLVPCPGATLPQRPSDTMPELDIDTPTLPGELVAVLYKALAPNPQDRFASVVQLRQAVQQAIELMPTSAMPFDNAGGWGAGPPQDEDWLDAPTWPGQGAPGQGQPGGGGQPPFNDGLPPLGGPPGGGWLPDNDPYHRRRGWPPLVALALALFLLVVCSSLAYGYFGLGWLHTNSGISTATPTATSSPSPTNTPTNTPAPTPTNAPSPTPAPPTPTSAPPSPSPTSIKPSPTPAPSTPTPAPSTPTPAPPTPTPAPPTPTPAPPTPTPAPAPSPSPPEPEPSPTEQPGP